MDNQNKKTLGTLGKQVTGAVVGATAGAIVGGPVGAVAGAALGEVTQEVLLRQLSHKEKSRIEKVSDLATQMILGQIESGAVVNENIDPALMHELYEGLLLKARDAYEEKKVFVYANICATAPFTNTPIQTIHQSLLFAERLSYQQLTIIAVLGKQGYMPKASKLSGVSFFNEKKKWLNEEFHTVYEDIVILERTGLLRLAGREVVTDARYIVPSGLILTMPGNVLYNAMKGTNSFLDEDLERIELILS